MHVEMRKGRGEKNERTKLHRLTPHPTLSPILSYLFTPTALIWGVYFAAGLKGLAPPIFGVLMARA